MYVPHTIVIGSLVLLLVLLFTVVALRYTLHRADQDLLTEHDAARHLALHLIEAYVQLSSFKQNTTTAPPGVDPKEMEASFDDDLKHVMDILGVEHLGPSLTELIEEEQ